MDLLRQTTGLLPSWRGVSWSPQWTWQSTVASAFAVPLLTILAASVISYIRSPLRRYPGPYFAGECPSTY